MRLPYRLGVSPKLGTRGLIATQIIKSQQILENCPLILIPKNEEIYLKNTILHNFYCKWNNNYISLILGYGSLINHSNHPNADFRINKTTKQFTIYTIRTIYPQEEITINYKKSFIFSLKDKLDIS